MPAYATTLSVFFKLIFGEELGLQSLSSLINLRPSLIALFISALSYRSLSSSFSFFSRSSFSFCSIHCNVAIVLSFSYSACCGIGLGTSRGALRIFESAASDARISSDGSWSNTGFRGLGKSGYWICVHSGFASTS